MLLWETQMPEQEISTAIGKSVDIGSKILPPCFLTIFKATTHWKIRIERKYIQCLPRRVPVKNCTKDVTTAKKKKNASVAWKGSWRVFPDHFEIKKDESKGWKTSHEDTIHINRDANLVPPFWSNKKWNDTHCYQYEDPLGWPVERRQNHFPSVVFLPSLHIKWEKR